MWWGEKAVQSLNFSWFWLIMWVFVFRGSNFGLRRKFEFSLCGCVWFGVWVFVYMVLNWSRSCGFSAFFFFTYIVGNCDWCGLNCGHGHLKTLTLRLQYFKTLVVGGFLFLIISCWGFLILDQGEVWVFFLLFFLGFVCGFGEVMWVFTMMLSDTPCWIWLARFGWGEGEDFECDEVRRVERLDFYGFIMYIMRNCG